MTRTEVYQKSVVTAICLGGNLRSRVGDPARTLAAALADLGDSGIGIGAVSRFYRSPAFPPGSGPDFVNAVALVSTILPPEALLAQLHATEARFGRLRDRRWGPRPLDIDLLSAGDRICPDRGTVRHWMALDPARQASEAPERLILPHPRLHERAFVLLPLAEVAPLWCHPVTGQSVAAMVAALAAADKAAVRPI